MAAKRILYFDLLSIAACLAVVFLHCNTLVHSFEPTHQWNQALIVEVLFYWAVPIFFMLTGANNIGYRSKYTTKTFLLRRMKKLLIPYLFWSCAIYYYHCFRYESGAGLSPWNFLCELLSGGIEPIYWFFPAIVSLTLAMPVISMLKPHRKLMWYVVGTSFVFTFAMPYICDALSLPWTGSFSLPVAGGFVTYALLGYLLSTVNKVQKKTIAGICLIAIICLVFRYTYTYIGSYELGTTDRTLFSYNGFFALFPAIAVFLLFKQMPTGRFFEKHAKTITSISGCCFGVYLIHKLIISFVFIGLLGLTYQSLIVRLVCPFVVFIVSCTIVYLFKKIPILRAIVP